MKSHTARPRLRDILRQPVGTEARRLLTDNWSSLSSEMQVPQQMFGRQGNGCGATIGAMSRCDFACRGCYLNAESNRVSAESVEAIKEQMRLRWRAATTEVALNPLRAEFAAMIRDAQRTTGLPLRAATTMTVTRENLAGVADVVHWIARHSDAFRLISFQPIAQVGRTEDGYGGGVDVDVLWDEVATGLGVTEGRMLRGAWRMATGTAVMAPLALVSHHFMSRDEIETREGRERLKHCVFRVPIDGELISMCEVNALGIRDQYYASLNHARTDGVVVE